MTMTSRSLDIGRGHDVLFYRGADEYVAAVASFVRGGLAAGESTLVAVPHPKGQLLQAVIGQAPRVSFVDIADIGRNPARITPSRRGLAYSKRGQPIRVVDEPAWPGRPAAEVAEVVLHESLIERAVAGTETSI